MDEKHEAKKTETECDRGRVKSWPVESVPGVECFCALATNHHYGRHSHDAYSIGVIEDGVGGNEYRGGVHYIPTGGVVLMNPGEPHTGYAARGTLLSYRMFYISEAAFRGLLPERAELPYFADASSLDRTWANRLRTLHGLLEEPGEILEKQVRLVETLSSLTAIGRSVPTVAPGANEPRAVGQIRDYLCAAYQENISIDELAQLTQLDRAYLIRSFRRSVGLPPHTYLVQIRIEQAKRLLSQGMPIAQVACEVGFADQSHLTRRFKSITGLTPRQFAAGHFRTRHTSTFA